MKTQTLSTTLKECIDEFYQVFAPYQSNRSIVGCPCCTTEEELVFLKKKNLQKYSASELWNYSMCAMTTIGTVDDFKYFLPRLAELWAQPKAELEFFLVQSKLEYAHWKEWPANEISCIEHFLIENLKFQFKHQISWEIWECIKITSALIVIPESVEEDLSWETENWKAWDKWCALIWSIDYGIPEMLEVTPVIKKLIVGQETLAKAETAFFLFDQNPELQQLAEDISTCLSIAEKYA